MEDAIDAVLYCIDSIHIGLQEIEKNMWRRVMVGYLRFETRKEAEAYRETLMGWPDAVVFRNETVYGVDYLIHLGGGQVMGDNHYAMDFRG